MEVKKLSEVVAALKNNILSSSLIPVIGSGFTMSMMAKEGIVPSGKELKKYMIDTMKKSDSSRKLEEKTFSQITKYYNRIVPLSERKTYFFKNFSSVKLSNECKDFLTINWPYIYTLNIDDGIEKNSDYRAIGPNREIDDTFEHFEKRVYKLHGDVYEIISLKDGDNYYIFDTDQYIESLQKNEWLLQKLKQDYIEKNIIFIGCSLDDEIDLLKVFSLVKNESSLLKTEKYYLTTHHPSELELIDLESYGITTVIVAETYDDFYETMHSIKIEVEEATMLNEIDNYKNIQTFILSNQDDSNKEYVLYEKTPFNKKQKVIYLPYFFISRKITDRILFDMDNVPLQVIYGKRVCGKSYILLDLVRRLLDRDVYYFDSRSKITLDNIDYLLSKEKTTILLDTNVLSPHVLNYIFRYDLNYLYSKSINVVLCLNTSRKEEVFELQNIKNNPFAEMYYVNNKFENKCEDSEYDDIRKKMSAANIPYFLDNKTIIDNILEIQKQLCRSTKSTLTDFTISDANYMQLSYLLLMANYGKLTMSDMIKFSLEEEPHRLMSKLDKAVEPDYRDVFMFDGDSSRFQIVCNAQAWLLGYLSKISVKPEFHDSFVLAFHHIAERIYNSKGIDKKIKKELFDFIKFDNINLLLGSARDRRHSAAIRQLIQDIYSDLKLFLGMDYQFNHQHAKCILWGIETLPKKEQKKEFDKAISTISLAIREIEDARSVMVFKDNINKSLAHAHFTFCMIRVKQFLLYPDIDTFRLAILQTCEAIKYKDNSEALELFDDKSDDAQDYSVSKFMDSLLTTEYSQYRDGLSREINTIVKFRAGTIKGRALAKV